MALGSPPEQALQLFPEQLLQPALHPVWLSALPRAEEHPLLPGHQDRQLVPLLLQRVVTQEEVELSGEQEAALAVAVGGHRWSGPGVWVGGGGLDINTNSSSSCFCILLDDARVLQWMGRIW